MSWLTDHGLYLVTHPLLGLAFAAVAVGAAVLVGGAVGAWRGDGPE